MKLVLQDWLSNCTWKEQTVLLCALRGPDAAGSKDIKKWVRWLRRRILFNAAPKKTFMQPIAPRLFSLIATTEPLTLDMLPVHYLTHLIHALQVIAYRHPLERPAAFAKRAYSDLCDYLHLKEESIEDMTTRLKDEV